MTDNPTQERRAPGPFRVLSLDKGCVAVLTPFELVELEAQDWTDAGLREALPLHPEIWERAIKRGKRSSAGRHSAGEKLLPTAWPRRNACGYWDCPSSTDAYA